MLYFHSEFFIFLLLLSNLLYWGILLGALQCTHLFIFYDCLSTEKIILHLRLCLDNDLLIYASFRASP
jgi:hypothetical protein